MFESPGDPEALELHLVESSTAHLQYVPGFEKTQLNGVELLFRYALTLCE